MYNNKLQKCGWFFFNDFLHYFMMMMNNKINKLYLSLSLSEQINQQIKINKSFYFFFMTTVINMFRLYIF